MTIENSLQWTQCETEFDNKIAKIPDLAMARQARKMLFNFNAMIKKLSQFELEARTSYSGNKRKVNEQLAIINTELSNFDQWILLLILIGKTDDNV